MDYYKALSYARQMRKNPTKAEKFFWEKVKQRQLGGYKSYRQYLLKHKVIFKNPLFYIVDFCCFEKKLVIEIDGGYHNDARQKNYDHERQRDIESIGYKVIRFTNDQVLKHWTDVEKEIIKRLNN